MRRAHKSMGRPDTDLLAVRRLLTGDRSSKAKKNKKLKIVSVDRHSAVGSNEKCQLGGALPSAPTNTMMQSNWISINNAVCAHRGSRCRNNFACEYIYMIDMRWTMRYSQCVNVDQFSVKIHCGFGVRVVKRMLNTKRLPVTAIIDF